MKRIAFSLMLSTCLALPSAHAVDVFPHAAGTATLRVPVKTMAELRFQQMLKQKYDFSCGSAALASLLTYHYNQPVEEGDVLTAMYKHGDKEKIGKVGFSMLDMKKYLETFGLTSEGYRASLDLLAKEHIPAIALINHRGYLHFVIVKGITKDHVLLGDPSSGVRVEDRDTFEKGWNGILFVITNERELGRRSFNNTAEWKHRQAPDNASLFETNLSDFTLDTSITPNYY